MRTTNPGRRSALAALVLAAVGLSLSVALPAGAASPPKRGTTTTTTVPAVAPCGGVTPPKSGGGMWQCTWYDEFGGTKLDGTKWVAQQTATSAYRNGPECYVDDPDNIAVANGVLRLTARKESATFSCASPTGAFSTKYTSGMVSTFGRFNQVFGRFEVRAKLPASSVKGLQSSLWLWPVDALKYGPRPASGEIDIAEVYSLHNDRAIPFVHYNTRTADTTVTNNYCMIADVTQFHTYALEWTTTELTILYDGQVCLVHRIDPAAPLVAPQPFDQPFLIALTQALGQGTNAFDPATTPLPAVTQVDYVRVWK